MITNTRVYAAACGMLTEVEVEDIILKKRVFFCADVLYPRGEAGANRVHYVAKSLKLVGYDVVIIAYPTGDDIDTDDDNEIILVEGIEFKRVRLSTNKYINHFQHKIPIGNGVLRALDSLHPCSEDVVFIYGSNNLYVETVFNYCKKRKISTVVDVAEWHQPHQYKFGKYDIRYIGNNRTFATVNPKVLNIVSISNVITGYYRNRGCTNILQLPATIEIKKTVEKFTVEDGAVNLIYPGNPQGKDNMLLMLKGIKKLSADERQNIVFHLTSVKPETIKRLLGDEADLLDKLKEHIVFHDWMDYDELISLYRKMDFLYMIRVDTLVTQANFPSKLPELMANGVIPIGNKVGDYYQYLSSENSILVENNSVEDCALALRKAISIKKGNRMLEYKQAAYDCACSCFDYRIWAEKTAEFIERCSL